MKCGLLQALLSRSFYRRDSIWQVILAAMEYRLRYVHYLSKMTLITPYITWSNLNKYFSLSAQRIRWNSYV